MLSQHGKSISPAVRESLVLEHPSTGALTELVTPAPSPPPNFPKSKSTRSKAQSRANIDRAPVNNKTQQRTTTKGLQKPCPVVPGEEFLSREGRTILAGDANDGYYEGLAFYLLSPNTFMNWIFTRWFGLLAILVIEALFVLFARYYFGYNKA